MKEGMKNQYSSGIYLLLKFIKNLLHAKQWSKYWTAQKFCLGFP